MIQSAPNCPVAKWKMKVDTQTGTDDDTIQRYTHKQPIYILFNPWCKGMYKVSCTEFMFGRYMYFAEQLNSENMFIL